MSAAAMLGPMLGISISASGPSFATAVMSSWDESMVPAARRYAFARYRLAFCCSSRSAISRSMFAAARFELGGAVVFMLAEYAVDPAPGHVCQDDHQQANHQVFCNDRQCADPSTARQQDAENGHHDQTPDKSDQHSGS